VIKVFPEVIYSAIRHNRPAGAFRLWFIAKHFDNGSGFIPAKDFRRYVSSLGVNEKTYYRWLDQAITLGLMRREGGANPVYRLAAWESGANAAGVNNSLSRAVNVPIAKFLAKGWLAILWAGYLKHFENKPVSRASLEKLTGIPARTQRAYEVKAGVRAKANYASYGQAPNNIDQALEFIPVIYRDGHYATDKGEVRRRLPDTRITPDDVSLANKGRIKRINQALCKEGSSQIYKLYTENAKQSKRAQRKIRITDKPNRPDYIYEQMKTLKGTGIYAALAV